jgi:hypothetical protein
MSEQSYAHRYSTFSPVAVPESRRDAYLSYEDDKEEQNKGGFGRYLTWSILSVCLGLWAVIGFIFWVPLLLRSMLQFSFALSQSMLNGKEPVESGRILRDTVSFYRRGFTVAIEAVFRENREEDHRPAHAKEREEPLSVRHYLREVGWAIVFWYVIFFVTGAVEASPVDGWIALATMPWADLWAGSIEWAAGLFS